MTLCMGGLTIHMSLSMSRKGWVNVSPVRQIKLKCKKRKKNWMKLEAESGYQMCSMMLVSSLQYKIKKKPQQVYPNENKDPGVSRILAKASFI